MPLHCLFLSCDARARLCVVARPCVPPARKEISSACGCALSPGIVWSSLRSLGSPQMVVVFIWVFLFGSARSVATCQLPVAISERTSSEVSARNSAATRRRAAFSLHLSPLVPDCAFYSPSQSSSSRLGPLNLVHFAITMVASEHCELSLAKTKNADRWSSEAGTNPIASPSRDASKRPDIRPRTPSYCLFEPPRKDHAVFTVREYMTDNVVATSPVLSL